VTSERDWLAELERAGVISRTELVDDNGNLAWRLVGFPAGEEGVRLRALFDQFVSRAVARETR
jgi:hypothetical protein